MAVTAEQNRANIIRFYEDGWNKGDHSVYEEMVAPDFVDHQAVPGMAEGREGFKMLQVIFKGAFPDLHMVVEDIIAQPDKVACRWRGTGTQTGELFGIPPTGKSVNVTATVIYKVGPDGKWTEGWINRDDLGMMRQLGVIPTPGE
jgi:predicted ester cyclase